MCNCVAQSTEWKHRPPNSDNTANSLNRRQSYNTLLVTCTPFHSVVPAGNDFNSSESNVREGMRRSKTLLNLFRFAERLPTNRSISCAVLYDTLATVLSREDEWAVKSFCTVGRPNPFFFPVQRISLPRPLSARTWNPRSQLRFRRRRSVKGWTAEGMLSFSLSSSLDESSFPKVLRTS